jgi:hypothetical protein
VVQRQPISELRVRVSAGSDRVNAARRKSGLARAADTLPTFSMPLFLRAMRDHYPDDTVHGSGTMDGFVALSGSYACGHFAKSARVRSERLLDWGCGFGNFQSSGSVETIDEAKLAMATAFRGALERAGLAEIEDARPGPPERETPPPAVSAASWAPPKPWSYLDHPIVIHQPRRMTVTSGELLVGLLHEINRAPYAGQWTWEISGTRPNPAAFLWNGHRPTLTEAQAALTAALETWLRWAGLRQNEPLRWRSD